jgi:hypothetical protein
MVPTPAAPPGARLCLAVYRWYSPLSESATMYGSWSGISGMRKGNEVGRSEPGALMEKTLSTTPEGVNRLC